LFAGQPFEVEGPSPGVTSPSLPTVLALKDVLRDGSGGGGIVIDIEPDRPNPRPFDFLGGKNVPGAQFSSSSSSVRSEIPESRGLYFFSSICGAFPSFFLPRGDGVHCVMLSEKDVLGLIEPQLKLSSASPSSLRVLLLKLEPLKKVFFVHVRYHRYICRHRYVVFFIRDLAHSFIIRYVRQGDG
jgi:hypothetical protein